MDGPETRLVAFLGFIRMIWVLDCGERGVGLLVFVIGCEGDVVCGVPVFGCDFEGKGEFEERVDGGENGTAFGHG